MGYKKVIKTSQNWVCPKTAYYLITAVAGGESGNVKNDSNATGARNNVNGGTTSFGNYLTVSGYGSSAGYGIVGYTSSNKQFSVAGGGGYTLFAYGGSGAVIAVGGAQTAYAFAAPTINGGGIGQKGNGYGGGGCGDEKGGRGGMIDVIEVLIQKDEVILCTIGAGGKVCTSGELASVPQWAISSGNDGCIVIQETGASA